MVIKQYKVEKGIATPVNPFNNCDLNWPGMIMQGKVKEWREYDDFIDSHTYATNAQDGVYDEDCFAEPYLQRYMEFENTWVKAIKNKAGFRYRNFLPFNPVPKMETTELPSPEKGVKTAQEMFVRPTSDEEVIELMEAYSNQFKQPTHNDYAVKVIEERIKEMEQKILNMNPKAHATVQLLNSQVKLLKDILDDIQ